MRSLLLLASLIAAEAVAQLDAPVPVQLVGAAPADRQVTGLADPLSPAAGVSVDAARANATSFAQATGTAVLIATLIPAPAQYTAGMVVSIVPQEANLAGATLNLNGLGPMPIVKHGDLPLDSADLVPGAPQRLIFDGSAFQVIGSVYRPCPAGYRIGAREYCIEEVSHDSLTFTQAGTFCQSGGARLCTFGEWLHACLSTPAFIGTVLNFEWVDHAANDGSDAKRVGRGSNGNTSDDQGIGCTNGHSAVPSALTRFRCCITR